MAAPAKGTSRTAQNDVASIKKKGPGALATAYLVIYNVVMTAGWLVIAVGLVRAYLSKGSYHGLYYSIERPLKFFQTGALLEVQNEDSVLLFVVAWTVTEIIRYSFYTFSLLNHLPYLIKWARYTLFIVLYPMGVTGELLTIYAALPYVQKTGLYSVTLPNKKIELYEMGWNLREGLRDCLIAAAPYGGPIALLKESQRRERSASARPLLEIYSAAGVPMASFPWKSGVVVHIGWTVSDDLLCIQEDGTVLIYDMFGNFRRHFSMGNEVLQNQVIEAKVFHSAYGTGVAIVTGAFRFTLATNIDDLKLRRLPEVPGLQVAPSCWAVLTQDRQTKVVLASGKDLYVLDNTACTPVTPPGIDPQVSSYFQMAVSFSYKYLALFTDTGHVWMGTSNLKEKLSEFDTKVRSPPKQMVWCRRPKSQQPSVVLMWDRLLLVAGKCKESIKYPSQCKESQKADEYLREIKEQNLLPEAVKQCVEAAGFEHEPETQKILLRVREYKQMTVQVLIDRLVFRRLYPLAIEICRYLKIPEFQGVSRVLKHWACFKVQQKEEPDDVIACAINQKLGDTAGISYSEIAARAYECGRTELAIKLLEFEPRSGEQVPLLLKMKRSQLALSKAIESGDTDLVYTVVTYLKNEMNRGDFFMTLRNQPVALSLYRQFCKHQEQNTLKDLFNQDDDHQELGNFYVRASYGEGSVEARMAALQNAVDEFNKAKNEFSARATEEQMKLLRWQRRFQEEFDKPYLDCSLHETVHSLLQDGKHKQAEQLYKDFRIPDKRFWWLKISALAEKEDWEELEKFSKSKKSPIGYLPFVEVCVKHQNKYEAKKYVTKVTLEQKVKAHLAVGDLEQAVEAAIERRSESELNLVLSRCTPTTDRALLDKINRARAGALKK
ncbi:Vacuolar protein sorting-associated protein 16-like [Acipenser ruthenus]|uniref:Vacuolar protein sorting-associated protein 16 homolog n=1 Tax=Acipenser ruthenus TaxID=7906 RepID=A0A444UCG0_ACIRT|nr:Vacuolar protein sorting-associated protein 16-like [Acipenser ruthenus]